MYLDRDFSTSNGDDLRTVLLRPDAGTQGSSLLYVATGNLDSAHIAWSKTDWAATWTEARTGTSNDILLRRFSDAGVSLDSTPLLIASSLDVERDPASAAVGDALAIGYVHEDPAVDQQMPRVRVRLFSTLKSPGAVCGASAECGSGACIAGVCCTTLCTASCATGVCSTQTVDAGTQSDAGTPDAGSTNDGGTTPKPGGDMPAPSFASEAPTTATCNEEWSYAPVVNGAPPFLFSFAKAPAGMTATAGALRWTPTEVDAGPHDVELIVNGSGGFASQTFTVTVDCPAQNNDVRETGCGCGATEGASVLLLLALLRLRRRR